MLQFVSESGPHDRRVTRREWLRIGGLAALGSAAPCFRATPLRAGEPGGIAADGTRSVPATFPGFGKARSVIVIFASGGQSQLDTWDPKPDAPAEVRGEFAAIPTAVPGTFLCEHMPRLARIADRYTIVRSMSHEDLDHGSAFYLSMTGHYHARRSSNPPPQPTDEPTLGALLKRIGRVDSNPRYGGDISRRFVHTAVHLNGPALVPEVAAPGQFGGFLGRDYEPLVLGDVTQERVVLPGLSPREDLPQVRLRARQSLLASLEEQCRRWEENRTLLEMDVLYRQAFDMLAQPKTRDAFNLSAEPAAVRDRYGRNRSGQACLLARRLVEAGVPLVNVIWSHSNRGQDKRPGETDFYGWDTHNDIFEALEHHLLPRFDQGFSALLEDLDERGLLDETLVVCLGEFGRAPLVALEKKFAGSSPGRKHWASAYSIVMAGAGVSRGNVLGRSDRTGGYPASEKYGPWDVTATLFSALGIDPATHYTDLTGRPLLLSPGKPIAGLYAG